ncbi:putative protein POLAR [Dioscorea sansibarensis]
MRRRERQSVSMADSQGRLSLDASLEEIASSRFNSGDDLTGLVEFVRDGSSLLSMQPWVYKQQVCRVDDDGIRGNCEISNGCSWDSSVAELSSPRSSVALLHGFGRHRSSLSSRLHCRHSVKPVSSSIEDNLVTPLKRFELKDYFFSSRWSSAVRPYIITDENDSVISNSSLVYKKVSGISVGAMETLVGVPPLPASRKSKWKSKQSLQHGSQKPPFLPGSSDAMLLFFLGISIGVMSTSGSNRKEVEKLTDLLKQTESLVQDLQEELDMNNSLTVKELQDKASESVELNEDFGNVDKSISSFRSRLSCMQTPEEKNANCAHMLSNIEAELVAELEKLELNMNVTRLDETNPGLVSNRRVSSDKSSTPIHDGNYSVSPRELSLRLHKVIQSRLEERIEELERALNQSQKHVKILESERAMSQTSFSNSYMGSSSQASPTLMEQDNAPAAPLRLKLSGDALSAYNEAYEEFMRTADADEDQEQVDGLYPRWEEILRSNRCGSGDDESDADDDANDNEGEILIKQIVERARKGSPVLIQAQRMLFSIDK